MEFSAKCMLVARESGISQKSNRSWNRLRFVEKSQGDTIECFVDNFGKFEKLNLYSDCDCKFKLFKDYKNNWRIDVEV